PPPLSEKIRPESPELDELDVEVDGDREAGFDAASRDSAPEIEPDDLLTEPEEPRPLSNRPPPPPKAQQVAVEKPKPEPKQETPAAEPAQKVRKKKAPRNWWEELFNDDYLRTVPVPHPKTIAKQTDFIEQRFGLSAGATILDVGCGL